MRHTSHSDDANVVASRRPRLALSSDDDADDGSDNTSCEELDVSEERFVAAEAADGSAEEEKAFSCSPVAHRVVLR